MSQRIFLVLLRRGRLTTSQLSKYTKLGQRQLRHGLVVLVQQNLVFHNLDEDTGLTYYEADHIAAYSLVRSGKILEAVESRHGKLAKDVVQNLLLLGHTKISDLEEAYEAKKKQHDLNNHSPTNSIENTEQNQYDSTKSGQICSTGQLYSTILNLLQGGVIQEVTENMFRSPTDTYNRIEKEILSCYFGGSTKGTKQKEELKVKIRARLQSLRSDPHKWQIKGRKRLHNGEISNSSNQANKHRKLAGSDSSIGIHTNEETATKLDSRMVIRVNYEKCTVFLRTQRLIRAADDRIGKITSLIYGEALKLLEEKISRCQLDPQIDYIGDEVDRPVFTTLELTKVIGDHINPGLGISNFGDEILTRRGAENNSKAHLQLDDAEVDGYLNLEDKNYNGGGTRHKSHEFESSSSLPLDRESKVQNVKHHLMLLSADQFKFLRKCGNAGSGEWTVDFEETINHIRESELDSMLLENFGGPGHRLVRILRKFGKLDEKQLPNMALMKQKDVRTKLAELQMAGIVDIQEVPKDTSRSVYRTIFLWYFDKERVLNIFLDNIYKTISRIFQRLDEERRKEKEIIRLTQRSDVRDQNPEDYLDKDQLLQLTGYLNREERLLIQITRLDELVGVFRDY